MTLPADSHVHSEWSWDTGGPASAAVGRMRATCARAVAIGLPVVIFTEHLDFDSNWITDPEDLAPHQQDFVGPGGLMVLPVFDVVGYLDSIERCRAEFPEVRILTGLEFGQPHLHGEQAKRDLDLGLFDRVNGSHHTLEVDEVRFEPAALYRRWPASRVMREYLLQIPGVVASDFPFEVFTHIDYAVRGWPVDTDGPFNPRLFEDEFRAAMRAIADSGRALELNTRRLWSWVPQWWAEEGGKAISFGSDSHTPESLAAHFPEAVVLAESCGFQAGSRPEDFWTR